MIFLVDTIGKETGMHLYDEAFVKEFAREEFEVRVLSNYSESYSIPLLRNFYHSGKAGNVILLLYSWVRLFLFYIRHRKDVFVYQSFGLRYIDIAFLLIFWRTKHLYTVIHDTFEITNSKGTLSTRKFVIQKWVYNHWMKKIICHSEQSVETLKKKCDYSGQIILYPHFRYHFNKCFDLSKVGEDVKSSIKKGNKNYLFFGQLRISKGVDVLTESFKYLTDNDDLNIIVAGSDKGMLMSNVEVPSNVVKILRYIKDDELNFLFTKCDAVLLPYKEIYQSGVLETVIHFEKYAVMSDLCAFKEVVLKYPSFGTIYSPNDGKSLANCLKSLVLHSGYSESDKLSYEKAHDIKILIAQMGL